jgi:hypothetical protein
MTTGAQTRAEALATGLYAHQISFAVFGSGASFPLLFVAMFLFAIAFGALHTIQNLWRPILLTRIDAQSSESQGATVLSIESQTCRTATMLLAPILGLAVDWIISNQAVGPFWIVGALGAAVALVFALTSTGAGA